MVQSAARRKRDDAAAQPYYTQASPRLLAQTPANANEKKPNAQEIAEWATIYQSCESRIASLNTWRLTHWNTWGQIARYMAPWRYYAFITANTFANGIRNDSAIVDRTATLAGEVCSAGLMSGMTDPDRPWLKLGPAIPGFELDKPGQMFYDDLTDRLRYIYAESNFYEAQAQHYDDLTFFGTSPVIDYESREDILHCFVPCAGEYFLGNAFDFTSETLYREFRLNVSQIVEMFGLENCPEDIIKMWRQKGGALDNESVIGHCIEPNYAIESGTGTAVGVVPGDFTWREVYWLRGKQNAKPLSMSGFHEQPFAVSRWDQQGNDPYGRGVGEKMLPDTIQLQLETRQKAESIEKVNRPPMGADVALMNQPSSINPGKITYMNAANGEKKFWPLFEIKPDIPAITADIEIVQQRIGRTAYNDVFRTFENLRDETRSQVTATEIDALKEERLIPLGPVIGRVYGSMRKRVRRHLEIMKRRDIFPRVPPSLRGVPLKIDFVSLLTQAQKATSTAAIARSVQFAGTVAAIYPQARYNIDPDEAVREFNEGVGAPSRILRSPAQVKKLVQAEVDQQKAAQAMQFTKEGAASAGVLSKASLAPGNALSALVGPQQ